ncbi:hypothetical protein [Pedobacter sp. D749]|uniref:hypothetical protein n=1 Tax=Pedobacter sp. D749 TaxID=2856523 RepID=UPI001C55CAF1|nr:hypothetical protein [Pedobacter sp. D749]QXU43076.1 hypothetical protein KYH19_05645 [Pedobacter sp. D749]
MPNSNDRIENARIWYGKNFDKSTSSLVSKGGKYSFPLTVKPKWGAAQFSEVEGQTEAYVVPLDINVPLELRQSVDPILIMRKNDSGYEAKLIGDEESKQSINTNNEGRTYNAKSLYQRAFGNQGELTQSNNSVRSNKPTINNTESSKLESHGLSPNKIMATELPPPGGDCIDWYIVTRDREGNIISEEFQGRTCGIDEMPGGGGGGSGDENAPKPVDFGIDPKCLNCKIPNSNFEAFLSYLKGLNFQLTQPFETTVTFGNLSFHGTMVEVWRDGARVGSFFTPDSSSDMFSVGIHYSVGFKGPDGYGNPPTYGYGITGWSFPTTYYNGKTNSFPMPPGGVIYTPPGQELMYTLEIYDITTRTFLNTRIDIVSAFEAFLKTDGRSAENFVFLKWAAGYLMANTDVSFEDLLNAEYDNATVFPANTDVVNYVELEIENSETRMVISPQDMVKYPKLTALVKGLYNRVASNPKIIAALVKYTGFTQTSVLNDLKFDKRGPIIYVTPKEQMKTYIPKTKSYNYPYGRCISDDANKPFIFLNKEFIDLLEAANGANADALVILLATTILHEYVHWSDNNFGLSPSLAGEMGELFEKDAFGGVLQYNKKNGKVYYRKQ